MNEVAVQSSEPRLPEQTQVAVFRQRVLVASDRLPIHLTREGGEGWRAARANSALVAALTPVLRERRGVWIGWPGVTEEEAPEPQEVLTGAIQQGAYSLRPVSLSRAEVRGAFDGFSGSTLWPLFHNQLPECRFELSHWHAYRRMNRKFARVAARTLGRGNGSDLLWVHNHLLMNVAAEARALGTECRAAFFLHIPFPSPDLFLQIPWRERLLVGLLSHELVGFQTQRDLKNFLDCAQVLGAEIEPSGELWAVRGETRMGAFALRAGAFPIGVDFDDIAAKAARPQIAAAADLLRAQNGGRKLVLGIDQLDLCMGLPEKLRAFSELLSRHEDLQEQVSLVQVVKPGRETLPRHTRLRREIERLVGEINGRFSRPGWIPVHYIQRALGEDEVLAWYRAADIALITPQREGMNLASKEYCAANVDERGALVLSELAGAAPQLAAGALLVNPHDARATARALYRALRMGEPQRLSRMRALRAEVRRHDIFWWADSFLAAALDERPRKLQCQEQLQR